ncbi:hypothetical protein Tco_0273107 [Tanacetum coccineum]
MMTQHLPETTIKAIPLLLQQIVTYVRIEIDQNALLNAELLKTKDMEFKEFKSDEHASMTFGTKQFKPRSSSNDIWSKWFKTRSLNVTMASVAASLQALFHKVKKRYDRQREIIPALNQQDEMNRFLHCSEHYRWKGKPSGLLRSTEDVEESNLPHFLDISRTQTR